jgi:nicotinate phosphoribosyltransferase
VRDGAWVSDANQALLTDLYQLTMLQAYWAEEMHREAVFTLFCRRLPDTRNYLVACGLADALRFLETVRFTPESIEYLAALGTFKPPFLEWLRAFRFTGDVFAVPEGTPVFANEPILEIVAPLPEAQLIETMVMNQVHLQTVVASKASRLVTAAAGRVAIDFGLRRTHGADSALKGARASYVAGFDGTSNVLAGQVYGIPIYGTMAHSYVQAHDSEADAFRAFAALYPDTTLLVDTYDTMAGVARVVALAGELGADFRVRAIRLDSGDLRALAEGARRLLDGAGLQRVRIFASGSLDEEEVSALVRHGAPIDAFGIGTSLGVSRDAPALDIAYKLTAYAGRGRVKTSPGKPILPGRKQLFRVEEEGRAVRDIVTRDGEAAEGRALLMPVMRAGRRLASGSEPLADARARARRDVALLPDEIRALPRASPGFRVIISDALRAHQREVEAAAAASGQAGARAPG